MKKALIWATLPTALLCFASYRISTHEPMDLTMPKPTPLFMERNNPLEIIRFESEKISDLPKVDFGKPKSDPEVKNCTQNRFVAYLLDCHAKAYYASLDNEVIHPKDQRMGDYTDNQFSDFMAWSHANGNEGAGRISYPGAPHIQWAKSIGASIPRAETGEKGVVDMEDTCSISRVGVTLVNRAKKASGSFDYAVYRDAKSPDGKYIIPRSERAFVDLWLSYIHAGER